MKISHRHQLTIARLAADSRWSHKCVTTLGPNPVSYVRKGAGYNARTLAVLRRAGLVESVVFVGDRGGRIVGIRLTDAGLWVAQRIADIAEGTAPLAANGDQDHTITTGIGAFTLEA